MKKSRFTESQIVAILKEADAGMPVNELWRKHGISSATYYKWKAKYGGLDVSELRKKTAWKVWVECSKSGRSFYYGGKRFQKTKSGYKYNCIEIETGDRYWISGPPPTLTSPAWRGRGIAFVNSRIARSVIHYFFA